MQKNNFLSNYKLEIVVFAGGFIGMVLELVGSRVISPYFGNSLIVWTSLIGVILGSLSFGYYIGGKIADKNPSFEILGYLLLIGAVSLGVTATFKEVILSALRYSSTSDIRFGSFMAVSILFAPASVILGMIAPFSAKIKLNEMSNNGSGKVVGNLYALSTAGSIIGTFLAGFYLIPSMGNRNLLYLLSLGLLFSSVIAGIQIKWHHAVTALFLVALYYLSGMGFFRLTVLEDIDSLYNRIIIGRSSYNGQRMITLNIDNMGVQSAVLPEKPDELVFDYEKSFLISEAINSNTKNALMIGGGGYSYPRYYLANHPKSQMDVVEIDPQITTMARKYFFLKENPRMNIYHEDAREFLTKNDKKYDVIFLDAFNSITPPYQLTTREFFEDIRKHLSPDGFLVLNLISAVNGDNADFFKLETNTLNSVFAKTKAFKITDMPSEQVQNLLIVSFNENSYASEKQYEYPEIALEFGSKALTDNWAPVEYITRNYYH